HVLLSTHPAPACLTTLSLHAALPIFGALISPVPTHGLPEIHAGRDETSVMLAIAPDKVRSERIAELRSPPDPAQVRATILDPAKSEEHTSELQSRENLVCRLLLEKKK